MVNYVRNGKPVFVGHARVSSVTEEEKYWKLVVYDSNFRIYRTYRLPKKKVEKKPNIGDYIRTYEVPTKIIGCDIGCNRVWDANLKSVYN